MGKKSALRYVCNNCGAVHMSWSGKCSSCDAWNSIEEMLDTSNEKVLHSGRKLETTTVDKIVKRDTVKRIATKDLQLDLVLGGGFVPGSVVLLAGQPGIGKSTLLLQIAHAVSESENVLYISGEESAHQVASRASRLKTVNDKLKLASSTVADDIARTITEESFALVIVDSIQTITVEAIASAAGTVSQITNSTQLLTKAAKASNTVLVLG